MNDRSYVQWSRDFKNRRIQTVELLCSLPLESIHSTTILKLRYDPSLSLRDHLYSDAAIVRAQDVVEKSGGKLLYSSKCPLVES